MKYPHQTVEDIIRKIADKPAVRRTSAGFIRINARCPICNDSAKNKRKRRFYCLEDQDHYGIFCHNCGLSNTLDGFLSEHYPEEYQSLQILKFNSLKDGSFFRKQKSSEQKEQEKIKPSSKIDTYLRGYFSYNCFPLTAEQENHDHEKLRKFALFQMKKRYIHDSWIQEMMFCYKGTFNWRVIIPFINDEGLYYNFQSRDIKPVKPCCKKIMATSKEQPYECPICQTKLFDLYGRKDCKYLFARFDDIELPDDKIFQEYRVSKNRTVFICEGIIDSMFIDNAIAMCNANIVGEKAEKIKNTFKDRVWVLDSIWTDKTGYYATLDLLKSGEKCFIMPKEHSDCKDINDLAIKMKVDRISQEYILSHTLQGETGFMKVKLSRGKFI